MKVDKPAPKPNPVATDRKQLAKDQGRLTANVAAQKKDDAAYKQAAVDIPGSKDLFEHDQKATDAQLGAQRKQIDTSIARDQHKLEIATLPSAKTLSKLLGAAKKVLARDQKSLKGVENTRKADDQAIATLEKANPANKATYQQEKQKLDAPLIAKAKTDGTRVAADRKNVNTLTREQKERAQIDARNHKGGGSFNGTGGWHPGPGSLKGADSSHWVSNAQFQRSLQGAKWSAIGATQGTGYVDPTFSSRWAELGQKVKSGQMKMRIAYHFMDPGNGTAQAKHFLGTLGIHGKLPKGTRLGLDFEAQALSDPQALHDAANYIHGVTGVWPVVYVQGSAMGEAQRAVPHAPIWEAAWGAPVNRHVPFVQYQSGSNNGLGYDQDVFNGNLAALDRFAGWTA
jgi:GH25 family lysozyme M1 (1,4-beta-N-acetylmuramidase)